MKSKFKCGDMITYEYDHGVIKKMVIIEVTEEDDETIVDEYTTLTEDGYWDTFDLKDPDDQWRIKDLQKNCFG